MTMLTVRNLDPHVKDKLRERAARHGQSMEAEVRDILSTAVESTDEPTDLFGAFRKHFADAPVRLQLPDRREQRQRPVTFEQ